MAEPAWLAIDCPRCNAPAGKPCWRTYPVLHTTLRAAEVPTPGYCTARATAAQAARR